jgi:transcription initiation factor IIE alpha subunit
MSGSEDYEFVCPECHEQIAVNEAMRTALLDSGCVICGTDLSPGAFSDL